MRPRRLQKHIKQDDGPTAAEIADAVNYQREIYREHTRSLGFDVKSILPINGYAAKRYTAKAGTAVMDIPVAVAQRVAERLLSTNEGQQMVLSLKLAAGRRPGETPQHWADRRRNIQAEQKSLEATRPWRMK